MTLKPTVFALLCTSTVSAFAQDKDVPDSRPAVTDEILVVGEREGYGGFSTETSSSLGMDMLLRELPASVSVVTDTFLDSTQTNRLRDVLTYIPGVNVSDDGGWTTDGLVIRGFDTGRQVYFDGLKQAPTTIRPHFATIERIEVVKGASGSEFGVVEAGGAVNVIRKRPFKGRLYDVRLGAGDFGYRRVTVDLNDTLSESGNVQWRVIGSYGESAEWRRGRKDNDNIYDYVFSPSINWDYSERGSLTAMYERVYQADPQDRGIIYLEGAFPGGFAPRDWSWHQNRNEQVNEIDRATIELKHSLNDAFSVRAVYSFSEYSYRNDEYRNADSEPAFGDNPYADALSWNGNTTFPASFSIWQSEADITNVKVELESRFEVAGISNTLVTGVRYFDVDDEGEFFGAEVNGNTTVDLFDPDPNSLSFDVTRLPDPFIGGSSIEETGYFAYVRSDFSDRFRTLVSIQYADFEADNFGDISNNDDVSVRLAGSYDVFDGLTAFFGYSTAFLPQVGVARGGDQVDPTHDESFEIGLKAALFDGRALWTNTAFVTNRSDIVASDPSNDPNAMPPESFVVAFGEVESLGFESEFVGSVTEQLAVRLGLALLDTEIVKAETGPFEGNQFPNTADFQGTAFVEYDFEMRGNPLTASVGARHMADRPGNSGNNITLPSYTTVDLGLRWRIRDSITLFAYGSNIFDETVILSMQDSGARADQVGVGERRLYRVGLNARF